MSSLQLTPRRPAAIASTPHRASLAGLPIDDASSRAREAALQDRLQRLALAQRRLCVREPGCGAHGDLGFVRADLPRAMRELADLLADRAQDAGKLVVRLLGDREDARAREEAVGQLEAALQDASRSGTAEGALQPSASQSAPDTPARGNAVVGEEQRLEMLLARAEEEFETLQAQLSALDARRRQLRSDLASLRRDRQSAAQRQRDELARLKAMPRGDDVSELIQATRTTADAADAEKAALTEGAELLDRVFATIVKNEAKLVVLLTHERPSSPQQESPSEAAADGGLTVEQVLDATVAALNEAVAEVDARGWTLLQAVLRSELEGALAAKELYASHRRAARGKDRAVSEADHDEPT